MGRGETIAVPGTIAAVMRMVSPRLNLFLYAKTPGGPFYLISVCTLLMEVLHRLALAFRAGAGKKGAD